jgi:RNA polymerase sigma-70 factor (ECF subfamily)
VIAVRASSERSRARLVVVGGSRGRNCRLRAKPASGMTSAGASPAKTLKNNTPSEAGVLGQPLGPGSSSLPRTDPVSRVPQSDRIGEGNRWVAEETPITASLIKRCIGGDASAWEEIVRMHNRRIYNICYRFTGSPDDAEDLTQDVFVKIYRTLASYDLERGAFTTWITTVTRNLLVDHFRRSKQDRVTDSMDAALFASEAGESDAQSMADQIRDEKPSPDARLATKETQKAVQMALQKLSPELREAVILRDLQDMDYKEIAAALKVPEGTVKSRINRGRTELARLLSRTYKQVN